MYIFYETEFYSSSSKSKKAIVSKFYFHVGFGKENIFYKNRNQGEILTCQNFQQFCFLYWSSINILSQSFCFHFMASHIPLKVWALKKILNEYFTVLRKSLDPVLGRKVEIFSKIYSEYAATKIVSLITLRDDGSFRPFQTLLTERELHQKPVPKAFWLRTS